MSGTLKLHVYLFIRITFSKLFFAFSSFIFFFFKQGELCGNKNKNTHRMLWIVKYYQLQAEAMQTADD